MEAHHDKESDDMELAHSVSCEILTLFDSKPGVVFLCRF